MSLTILSASAGAGKTYRLSREFVVLCLSKSDPEYSSAVLAMTFTNKATEEMKNRVLSLLKDISDGKVNSFTEREASEKAKSHSALLELFNKESEAVIQKRAGNVIKYLLKKYHVFSIYTIDSFFQKIVRQFQRELSLDQAFRIELDQETVLSDSINKFLNDLTPESEEFQWLIKWVQEKFIEESSWDIRTDLQDLGNELFKEGVAESWTDDISMSEIEDIYSQLLGYIDDTDNYLKAIRDQLKVLIDEMEVPPEEFKYLGGSIISIWLNPNKNIIELNKSSRFLKGDQLKEYTGKNNKLNHIIESYFNDILELHNKTTQLIDSRLQPYCDYKIISKKFRTYIALRFLYVSLRLHCKENDIVLLSESNKLVNKVIDEQYADILFEKSGQRYQHIMIDEFQDTSAGQWKNLQPLFENSLANNNDSLIVGDIKQAIYRWRNGDWKIMHEEVKRDLHAFLEVIVTESLPNNFRSAPEIVAFNNQLYKNIVRHLIDIELKDLMDHPLVQSIESIYRDVAQVAMKSERSAGFAKVTVLKEDQLASPEAKEGEDEEEEQDTGPKSMEKQWLEKELKAIFEQNYKPGDIAILVRTSKNAALVMDWLQEWKVSNHNKNYESISDNGLLLKNSNVIQLLIYALKWKTTPYNKALLPNLFYFYHQVSDTISDHHETLEKGSPLSIKLLETINHSRLTTLSEWFVYLIKSWSLETTEVNFMSVFLDEIRSFELTNGNDPRDFLAWWQQKESTLGIAPDENQSNAIRVLTIHKSKGLQFPVVIIPFTDQELFEFKQSEVLYIKPRPNSIANRLGAVPIHPRGNLVGYSSFKEAIQDEMILKIIDNLNLLYVATTRAEERLIIGVAVLEKAKNDIGKLIINCLPEGLMEVENNFMMGELTTPKWRKNEDNVQINETINIDKLYLNEKKQQVGVWIKKELIGPMTDKTQEAQNDAAKFGIIIHEVLSRIITVHDLSKVLNEILAEGLITQDDKEQLKDRIHAFLELEDVKGWFKPSLKVYTEKEILTEGGKSYKPDRVVLLPHETILIDFKTGKASDAYKSQIKNYSGLLQSMGLPNVSCYLAYVDLLEIDSVN